MLAVYVNAFTHAMNPVIEVVIRALSHVLVPMFLVGMAGAALVVATTVVQDATEFLSAGEEPDTVVTKP